jgi:hypothetical protein
LFAAALLQLLLKTTLALEHHVANYFNSKTGTWAKFMRYASAWGILFASKFVILGMINFAFGNSIKFSGPLHGVAALIVVLIVMVAIEEAIARLYRWLA